MTRAAKRKRNAGRSFENSENRAGPPGRACDFERAESVYVTVREHGVRSATQRRHAGTPRNDTSDRSGAWPGERHQRRRPTRLNAGVAAISVEEA